MDSSPLKQKESPVNIESSLSPSKKQNSKEGDLDLPSTKVTSAGNFFGEPKVSSPENS